MDPLPDDEVPPVDLSAFAGCWHLASRVDQFFGNDEVCLAALDSVTRLLKVNGADSVFASIDSVSDLTFVPPYRGRGDFSGTTFSGPGGSVAANYRDLAAGGCTLVTSIEGDVHIMDSQSGERFTAFYTVHLHFESGDSCSGTGTCSAFVTFEGSRRSLERCAPPLP